MQFSTVFQQFLALVPRSLFDRSVEQYQGNRYTKNFSCWSQFVANLYAQVSGKVSLRDIELGLKTQKSKWYHLGLSGIARSTLARANQNRDYRIYQTLFYTLLQRCKMLAPKHDFRFNHRLYSLDATVIGLCLALFPWAKYRRRKGAIKLHCLLDHSGDLPSFLVMTEGRRHDVDVVKELELPLSRDSILIIDRGYVDFEWLWGLNQKPIFFVTRMKDGVCYDLTGQHENPLGKGVLADQTIRLTGLFTKKKYPEPLRIVTFYDEEEKRTYRFLTNNFALAPATIAAIYKARWQVELFFKWIKQHLKIKTFLGTSENAVLTQIWTAMIHYLLLSHVKFQTKYDYSLLEFSRLIQNALFDRIALIDLLSLKTETLKKARSDAGQTNFVDILTGQ